VLLIEADLRHPVLAGILGVPPSPGLSDVLAGRLSWEEALVSVPVEPSDDPDHAVHFDLVSAGGIPPNPTDLIGSERMKNLLEDVAANYRLVIIDTPPTVMVSDAIPLLSLVDGVIVVSRLNKSTRDSLRHLQRQLDRLAAPVLGVVINGVTRRTGSYGYAYEYPYGRSRANGSGKMDLPEPPTKEQSPVGSE
jgi:capsular exopolysaccharide synthesis family protein